MNYLIPPTRGHSWRNAISIQHLFDALQAEDGLVFSSDLIEAAKANGLLTDPGVWCLVFVSPEGSPQGVTFTVRTPDSGLVIDS